MDDFLNVSDTISFLHFLFSGLDGDVVYSSQTST
jgi:hypothetical protein